MKITSIDARTYRHPLDPPFAAAWDPVPRTSQEATVVIVTTDEGVEGIASGGDGLPDRALLARLLRGRDPRDVETVQRICETVDFHGGRPWAVEVACWDIAGKAAGVPVAQLAGGRAERLVAYASCGERVDPDTRAGRAVTLADAGIRALKLRFHADDPAEDIETVQAVRAAVGSRLEIMVDANQAWRMPGDLSPRWDVPTARRVARALERLDVYWLEEPLDTFDVDGYRRLRRSTDVRIAAGEMVRHLAEARALVTRGAVDVVQPDVVLTGGIAGCRALAALAERHGCAYTPHSWSNGVGLIANLHAACGFGTSPFVEVPFDPPAWSAERRDWLLGAVTAIASDGTIAPPPTPGLGVDLDLDALERFRVA